MLAKVVTAREANLAETEIGSSSSGQRNFQMEDNLDKEIENIRRLMVKVSQKQQTTAREQRNFNKGKTRRDCECIAGGELQNKVWKLGEVQLKDGAAVGQQKNRVWDPGGSD